MLMTCIRLDEANRAVVDHREQLERQNQQLADYEAEINLLRRRVELLDKDREKDRRHIAQLQDALNKARIVRQTKAGILLVIYYVCSHLFIAASNDSLAHLGEPSYLYLKDLHGSDSLPIDFVLDKRL